MLLGGDPCDEHSGSGSYYCLGGGGGASGGNNNNNEMDDGVAMMGGNEAAAAAAAGGRRWGQQGQGDGGGGNGQTEQLRQSLVGKDSPPTSTGGQRERRFPAVGTMAYMAPEVEHDSRFGVQVGACLDFLPLMNPTNANPTNQHKKGRHVFAGGRAPRAADGALPPDGA